MKKALLSYEKSLLNKNLVSGDVSVHWMRHFDLTSRRWNKINKIKDLKLQINPELICTLENFRYKKCLSKGADDSRGSQEHSVDTISHYLRRMNSMVDNIGRDFVEKNISDKNIGNTDSSFNIGNKRTDYAELFFIKWYSDIKDIVFEKKVNSICEIGAGFGGFASVILRNHNSKYIIIDLPQSNLITHYFLSSHFKDKKIFSYIDLIGDEISEHDFESNDIFILPQWVKLPNFISVDFFINTRSMMEMNKNVKKKYFDLIHSRISKGGYFLNINRYVKNFGDANEISKLHEYPYDSNWDVIISKESYRQRHIRFLLTKRVFDDFENNILFEIKKIEEISRGFKS